MILHTGAQTNEVSENNPLAVNIVSGQSFESAETVTPSDSTVLTATKSLYIGTEGDLLVTMANGAEVAFKGVHGELKISVTKVKAATTATDIVALY